MVGRSTDLGRRLLNFPVVRPGESVAFSSLLASLINLGRTVCGYKRRAFYSNKKNARKTIRLIESLVILLEDISPRFGNSLVLSLSELHCVFQKVVFLLEDCTREDTRLWMLMKSEKVSGHFMEVFRGITMVMDVMPLAGLDVEIQELAEFIRIQALNAKFEVERDDGRFVREVIRVLTKFEAESSPESCDLKRILEYLQLSSWYDCQKEIHFLESEIREECSTVEKRELALLSSLMAFLIYCRCTLFVDVDSLSYGLSQYDREEASQAIRSLHTDCLKCPITLEIMTDPVTISSGQTFDRSSISKWFSSGNFTCPMTGESLSSSDLVPNVSLRRLIKEYCLGIGISYSEPDSSSCHIDKSWLTRAGSLAAAKAMSLISSCLVGKLSSSQIQEQQKSAYEIRLLTKSSIFNRSCFVENDSTIPSLLMIICSGNPGAQENGAAALLNLSKYPKSKNLIVENGGLSLIVDVLTNGLKAESRQHAAGALFYLSSVEDYRRKVGEIPLAIPALIHLLNNGSDRGKKNALLTILVLLMCPENHSKFLKAGVVPLLINILKSSERDDLSTHSLAVLATLAEKYDGSMAIISSGSMPIIIGVIDTSSSRSTKENCISLLLSLCLNVGGDVVRILAKNQSLIVSLYSILTSGTSRSTKKANSLLRILHAFNEMNSSASIPSGLPHEQLVHVR